MGNQVPRKKEGQKIYAGLNFWSVGCSLTYDIYEFNLYEGEKNAKLKHENKPSLLYARL